MGSAEDLDGRRLRAVRSREAVVDAVLDLIRETGDQPSAQATADRAGVSLRTVFRLFDDTETLLATAVTHQVERVAPLLQPIPATGTVDARIRALVAHRQRLFEEIAPIRRAALVRAHNANVRSWLEESRARLRQQVTDLFAAELKAVPARQRKVLSDALELAAGFPAWNALRIEQGLDAAGARAVLAHTLARLLS